MPDVAGNSRHVSVIPHSVDAPSADQTQTQKRWILTIIYLFIYYYYLIDSQPHMLQFKWHFLCENGVPWTAQNFFHHFLSIHANNHSTKNGLVITTTLHIVHWLYTASAVTLVVSGHYNRSCLLHRGNSFQPGTDCKDRLAVVRQLTISPMMLWYSCLVTGRQEAANKT